VVIGVDPNAGPNVRQWSTVLNAVGSFPLYQYKSVSAIHAAVKGQHKSFISALLGAGADVNIGDANGVTPLMSSLVQGDDKVTKDLLFIGQARVNAVDRWGNNVVKYSFLSPPSRKLLAAVAPQSISANSQARASTLEVLTGKPVEGELASPEITVDSQDSAVVSGAAVGKELEILCTDRNLLIVLSGGADVSTCDADGNYPLHWLGRGTSLEYSFRNKTVGLKNPIVPTDSDSGYFVSRADHLIKNGAAKSIDGCNKFGQTALHVALASGLTALATRLLSAGANPNIVDGAQNLPLHLACVGWAPGVAQSVVPTLLKNGAGKSVKRGTFDPSNVAMGLTNEERESQRIQQILDRGLTDHVTCPASIVRKQIMIGDLLKYPNAKGHGPFHIACGAAQGISEPLGPASLPIDVGSFESRPSVDDVAGDTSRGLAEGSVVRTSADNDSLIKRTRFEVIELLLAQGADPNGRSMPYGLTGLHFAARASSTGDPHTDELIVDTLVNAGGDINAVDAQTRAGGGGPRYAPLHYALKSGSEELAWHLLRVDNALTLPATANPPALLLAAEVGVCPSMIGYLVQHGGEDPNITGMGIHQGHRKYSGTSLHLAAERGNSDVVTALLLAGVDTHDGLLVDAIRPHNGRTALHLAAFHGHLDIVKNLIEDGKADKFALDNVGEVSWVLYFVDVFSLGDIEEN
jgi:ankyrin repeat protein